MGYCVDVHICVNKEDLPILYSCDEMYMFTCSYRAEGLVYAYVNGLKMRGDWWDNIREKVEQCKEYHWIIIGEDGQQSEDYSNEPLMSVITTIDVPPLIKPIDLTNCKLHQEILNVLKLVLPNEYSLDSSYIIYRKDNSGGCLYIAYLYTIDGKVYINRTNKNLFDNIFKILNDNYLLVPIKEGVYEIKYKP